MILGGCGHIMFIYCLVFYFLVELGFSVNIVITFYLKNYCLYAVHAV